MSDLEDLLVGQLRLAGLPAPVREHRFAPPRRWRFDLCWPNQHVAVECEGGTFSGGRHTRGAGFEADVEKYNEATLGGWRVLRVTRSTVESGVALSLVERALGVGTGP